MEVEPTDAELIEVELNPMPDFVSGDRKDREAFLSLLGNFSTEERGIFHLLCENWDHEIGYAKFVTKNTKNHPIDEKDIKTLMIKLRACGCGILLTKYLRGERGVDKIILTDVHSKFFFFYFINNEYQKNYGDISIDFVNDGTFEKYGLSFTELSSIPLELSELNKGFIKSESIQSNIFIITNNNEFKPLYVTSDTLQDLLKISVRKVKYYFKSESFIAFIAKLMDTSISKIKADIDQFDISKWKDLTKQILNNKKVINGKFKNISSSFFKSILITSSYCLSELEHRDKELEDEKKLREVLKQISGKIREQEFTPLTQESFNALFDIYEADSPEIKSKFYELFVDNKTMTGLTEIVFVGQHYMHQDNLYKVFLDRIAVASTELNYYFVSELKRCLATNSSDQSLYVGYPFECTIMTKLKSDYPILNDFINRKGTLAEGIIHFSKKKGHSQGKMHSLLALYFREGSSELRDINLIFNLDLISLYEQAYISLPSIKRFLILITGQYSRNLERFTGHRKVRKPKEKAKPKKKKSSKSSNKGSDHSSSHGNYQSHGKSLIKEERVKKKDKHYNQEQQDTAWSSLGSELTKKKRT
ncbi:MAG: hypothetical protein OCD02_23575 [Spirochaetaceae bacterium]